MYTHQDLIAARDAFEDIARRASAHAGMFASMDEYGKVERRIEVVRSLLSSAIGQEGENPGFESIAIGQEGENPGFESIEEAVFSRNYWRNVAHSLQQEIKGQPDNVSADLNVCPKCGGEADNGHDRCYPPNVYYCKKCSAAPATNGAEE